MFEAIVTVCVASELCRAVLLPGYEAATQEGCVAALGDSVPGAACRAIGPALTFEEVAPGVFVHSGAVAEPDQSNRGDVSNIGFVIGAASVAVIDSGTARWMGEAVWRSVRARTDLPVSHVIVTHMHPDHALGATVFADAGAEVIGHASLQRALADRQANYLESLERLIGPEALIGTAVPEVTLAVAEEIEVDLGARPLTVRAWPTAHTGTDVTVLDQTSATLFAGDLLFHRHLPALDGSLRGWQAVMQEMQGIALARIVPGHGAVALPWPEGGADQRRYLDILARETRAAIDAGERLATAVEHIAESERPQWELFDDFNPRNATVAYTELEWE